MTYASPAWYGFTSAADHGRLDTFLRQSARLGYRDAQSPSFGSLCETADEQLFVKIMKNKQHLLRSFLPSQHEQHYKRRDRVHNFQLPTRTSSTIDSNFIMQMLFKNSGCAS